MKIFIVLLLFLFLGCTSSPAPMWENPDKTNKEFRDAGIFHEGTTILASHMSLAFVEPYDDLKDEVAEMGMVLGYDGIEIEI